METSPSTAEIAYKEVTKYAQHSQSSGDFKVGKSSPVPKKKKKLKYENI